MRNMAQCCPQARGCNAPEHSEPCLLDLCRRAAREVPEAALALARWEDWQRAREHGGRRSEWRFRKRAYERARAAPVGGHGSARAWGAGEAAERCVVRLGVARAEGSGLAGVRSPFIGGKILADAKRRARLLVALARGRPAGAPAARWSVRGG